MTLRFFMKCNLTMSFEVYLFNGEYLYRISKTVQNMNEKFVIYVGLSGTKNYFRPESRPLSFRQKGLPKNVIQNRPIYSYKTVMCELVTG